jgi:saccharopine dehydrogenase-like NADP-dependent oxidoreductase
VTQKKIIIAGTGNIGILLAKMLSKQGLKIFLIDQKEPKQIPNNCEFNKCNCGDITNLEKIVKDKQAIAIISCLPFSFHLNIAKIAIKYNLHYFDPTEDVQISKEIAKIAKNHNSSYIVPQNGLAPGFISIIAANLAKLFDPEKLNHLKLRVGAIPKHPIGELGYSANWSINGLVNEYLKDSEIIEDGIKKTVNSLTKKETLRIDGADYEAFLTSGGIGTLSESFATKTKNLNYKTIRYPGHLAAIKLLFNELKLRNDPETLIKILTNALPSDIQDRVLIHCQIEGKISGKTQIREFTADYPAIELFSQMQTAISWTTAASIAAIIELAMKNKLGKYGFKKLDNINIEDFLATQMGQLYKKYHQNFFAYK